MSGPGTFLTVNGPFGQAARTKRPRDPFKQFSPAPRLLSRTRRPASSQRPRKIAKCVCMLLGEQCYGREPFTRPRCGPMLFRGRLHLTQRAEGAGKIGRKSVCAKRGYVSTASCDATSASSRWPRLERRERWRAGGGSRFCLPARPLSDPKRPILVGFGLKERSHLLEDFFKGLSLFAYVRLLFVDAFQALQGELGRSVVTPLFARPKLFVESSQNRNYNRNPD
jgi:hypothetical protein